MKKQVTALFLALLLGLTCLVISTSAAGVDYVHSDYGYFPQAETDELSLVAEELYNEKGVEVFFTIAADVPDDGVADYAKQYYKENALGDDGMILLLTDNKWYIYSTGKMAALIDEQTEDGLWDIYNKAATYYDGVEDYLNAVRDIIEGEDPHLMDGWTVSNFIDNADLLSETQETALRDKLNEISLRQLCDVVIVTADSFTGHSVQAYADDIYDSLEFGFGDSWDGLLFFLSMEDRDWAISTCGAAISYFTDAGQDYIFKEIKSSLADNDFDKAFNDFADLCDDFITKGKSGKSYDVNNLPGKPVDVFSIVIAVILSALIAFIPVNVMKGKLKSVRRQAAAGTYVRDGSLNLVAQNERFLYSKVNSHRRESSSGSSSGGSSTHTSSSGRTHGGSSGKF